MKYILSEEEMSNMVSKEEPLLSEEKIAVILKVFRNSDLCVKYKRGYCDDCPIASINNYYKFFKICDD